ncbi:site-specific DNA-cytosine methylase [Rubricella aquisinus]|uniref:Site-specific DNA-cytosine methylase n=1 Tax=Rubricella aquisinus TaxID=2028108 RepID=A0A840X524_9RHOB|nr:DNA cytosine methyltransferase [Rubricella aquisinus]MBB5515797.1 site-specific DNA-cytosine methylase [Rubricella aquisinus]
MYDTHPTKGFAYSTVWSITVLTTAHCQMMGNAGLPACGADAPMHKVTSRDRFGLVTVTINGQTFAIVNIGMRMLTPRELFRAQGFPDSYIIERGADGRCLTKTEQIRMCGNSVCPQLAEALVRENCMEIAATTGEGALS